MMDATYPQYEITVRYQYDRDGERIDDVVQLHRMYREDPGEDGLVADLRETWWPGFVEAKGYQNPGEPTFEVRYQGEESWCLSWFEHWTFDIGQSDREALGSFERYVRRYEHMQDYYPGEMPEGYRCLMGAEDRWRWTGGPSADEKSAPPCRCEHCQKQGKLRIGH